MMGCYCRLCNGIVEFHPESLQCDKGHSLSDIDYAYLTSADKGRKPRQPKAQAVPEQDLADKLGELWMAHVFSRALTPPGNNRVKVGNQFRSASFYTFRGLGFHTTCTSMDRKYWPDQRIGRAGDLLNQSFLIRLWTMLEGAFVGEEKDRRKLPCAPGLSALLLLKLLRNHYAHTLDTYTDEFSTLHRDVVGPNVPLKSTYGFNLDIDRLLQRLWADSVVYVHTCMDSKPARLGVVVASESGPDHKFLAIRPGVSEYLHCSLQRSVNIGSVFRFDDPSLDSKPAQSG